MKLRLLIVLMALVCTPVSLSSKEARYQYCLFAGYFGPNNFFGDLALTLAARDGLIGESVCLATVKKGAEIGQRIQSGRIESQEDLQAVTAAQAFSAKVFDFVIKGAKL